MQKTRFTFGTVFRPERSMSGLSAKRFFLSFFHGDNLLLQCFTLVAENDRSETKRAL